MKYFFVLTLTSLPFLSWIGQYYFSKKHSLYESFKKHWTCYRGDWLFVLVNLFFLFSVKLSFLFVYLLLISFFVNVYTHLKWGKDNKINKLSYHFFLDNTDKLNGSGIIHFIFSTIEMAIIASIFLLQSAYPFIYFEMFFVAIFAIFIPYGAHRINSRITRLDVFASSSIFVMIFLKILF